MQSKYKCVHSPPSIQHSRLPDFHRADARQDRPLRQMPVANDLALAAVVLHVLVRINPLRNFGFDGLR